MGKRYYWLKLPDDFFRQKPIKKLRRIAGGDTYTIIYLKMLLVSLKNEGKLFFDGVEENFTEEIALELDEEEENVKVTVQFLMAQGLLQLIDESEYELTECSRMVGSESASAERMRRLRDMDKSLYNASGCKDRTAHDAICAADRTRTLVYRASRSKKDEDAELFVKMVKRLARGFGFKLCDRIKFEDPETGKKYV